METTRSSLPWREKSSSRVGEEGSSPGECNNQFPSSLIDKGLLEYLCIYSEKSKKFHYFYLASSIDVPRHSMCDLGSVSMTT